MSRAPTRVGPNLLNLLPLLSKPIPLSSRVAMDRRLRSLRLMHRHFPPTSDHSNLAATQTLEILKYMYGTCMVDAKELPESVPKSVPKSAPKSVPKNGVNNNNNNFIINPTVWKSHSQRKIYDTMEDQLEAPKDLVWRASVILTLLPRLPSSTNTDPSSSDLKNIETLISSLSSPPLHGTKTYISKVLLKPPPIPGPNSLTRFYPGQPYHSLLNYLEGTLLKYDPTNPHLSTLAHLYSRSALKYSALRLGDTKGFVNYVDVRPAEAVMVGEEGVEVVGMLIRGNNWAGVRKVLEDREVVEFNGGFVEVIADYLSEKNDWDGIHLLESKHNLYREREGLPPFSSQSLLEAKANSALGIFYDEPRLFADAKVTGVWVERLYLSVEGLGGRGALQRNLGYLDSFYDLIIDRTDVKMHNIVIAACALRGGPR
ncbi:hypothetical protein TL16_g12007 [Triparma laevis f. inornata]|uniref:Uncharacterized protein n=1 Tax=Triparma laevis f. inornata TaxID=1714386 RepID=A0A9W7BNP4_9STRA|nr:hypothetical protein TL16_g12007 [Triparma laevis f. inornata]